MPRENNTNFLLKARILHAKPEDTLPCIPQLVPLSAARQTHSHHCPSPTVSLPKSHSRGRGNGGGEDSQVERCRWVTIVLAAQLIRKQMEPPLPKLPRQVKLPRRQDRKLREKSLLFSNPHVPKAPQQADYRPKQLKTHKNAHPIQDHVHLRRKVQSWLAVHPPFHQFRIR